jgi:hypothetical protein
MVLWRCVKCAPKEHFLETLKKLAQRATLGSLGKEPERAVVASVAKDDSPTRQEQQHAKIALLDVTKLLRAKARVQSAVKGSPQMLKLKHQAARCARQGRSVMQHPQSAHSVSPVSNRVQALLFAPPAVLGRSTASQAHRRAWLALQVSTRRQKHQLNA